MKHVIIFAHPNQDSFTGSVAAAYEKAAHTIGHDVVIRDLYRMGFQPCLQAEELPFAPHFQPGADVIAERRLLADADVFALCYPFWLNAPPAILKGYLDRVFGFGFAYGKGGRSEPLLNGRRLMTVTSSGAPLHWVQSTGTLQSEEALFARYFAELCGMTFVEHIHFGAITPGASDSYIKARLSEVESAVVKHFGSSGGQASHAQR
jgi:NAD(P)H dehydrogenase (quinone)